MKGDPLEGDIKELHDRIARVMRLVEENEVGMYTWHKMVYDNMNELCSWWFDYSGHDVPNPFLCADTETF